MTTLTRDNITGGFKLPDDASNRYNTATGQPNPKFTGGTPSYANLGLAPGVTGSYNPQSTTLTFNLPDTQGAPAQQQQSNPSTVSFTTALIKMLQEAQGRDTTGQARLMKQSQGITGQGINDAVRNFNNPLLAPSSGTSLGMSAQNQFDPLTLSIANQQKLASQNLSNFDSIIGKTQSAYDKEQDRIERAEEKRLDRIAAAAKKESTFDTDARIREFSGNMKKIKGSDGYIDPNEWKAARDLWQSYGGSDATFESNFKRYLNPLSYKLVGYKEEFGGITAKQQALIDALKK